MERLLFYKIMDIETKYWHHKGETESGAAQKKDLYTYGNTDCDEKNESF